MDNKAVVLHSGGQDSTTCLAYAAQVYGVGNVFPLQINYGQRHAIELECGKKTAIELTGRAPAQYDLEVLHDLGGTALTDELVDVPEGGVGADGNVFAEQNGLPATFVPGRNLLFLSIAAAYAAKIGSRAIYTGVCQADAAGYPDCRQGFIDHAEQAINSALGIEDMAIFAPLMNLSKAMTWRLAEDIGVLETIRTETHTCYNGNHELLHSWGYGCGTCGACLERAKGYVEFEKTWHGVGK